MFISLKKSILIIPLILFYFFLNIIPIFSQAPDTGLAFIEGGKFRMGNKQGESDENPVHTVILDDFYIGKYEVTNSQFAEFLNENGNKVEHNSIWILLSGNWRDEKCRIYFEDSVFKVEEGYENYPVTFVNWNGADAYCKWKGGRLPTEAEWEYVAKGGNLKNDSSEFFLDEFAVYKNNSEDKPAQVGSKKASVLGIYDLFGNMTEWTTDWYNENYYKTSVKENPQCSETGDMKVIRGGSWYNSSEMISATNRRGAAPNFNNITIGFRIAYSIK